MMSGHFVIARRSLNLQHAVHHRHAAPAERHADNLAAAFLGAGFEHARPAHIDALSDTKRKFQIGLGPQAR